MSGEPPPVPMDFPENIIEEIKVSLLEMEGVDHVIRRPLRPTDPTESVGVFAMSWSPEDWQIGQFDPAVTQYLIAIQTFVKHGNEEEGVTAHARLAKRVRVMLYRDDDLRLRLGTLSAVEDGLTERTQRWGVRAQRYLSNELQGNFLFLAVTELWVETEIV